MALSDFGNQVLVTDQYGVTFDLNKDYSAAIAAAKAAGQDTTQLEAERAAKINSSAYGGAYKTGSTSSSLGTAYNENATVANRVSNQDPISVNYNQQQNIDPLNNIAEYLKELYAQNTAAELAALKSTYEQNVADVEANVPKINEMYEAARNQTAAQSEIDKRNFAEYANARSLNTGTSGQAELARQVALTGNLAGLSGQEANALAENDLQKQQLTIAYRNAIDQATAAGNASLAQALYAEYVRQIEANTAQSQLDREYAYNIAMGSLQAGIVPDANTLASAGISATDANNLASYYKLLAATTANRSGSSSGSRGSSGSGTQKSNSNNTTSVNKVYTHTSADPDQYLGDRTGNSSKTSLNFNEDEGVFTWNGNNYYTLNDLASAINKAGLTADEKSALEKKFDIFGFNISFN